MGKRLRATLVVLVAAAFCAPVPQGCASSGRSAEKKPHTSALMEGREATILVCPLNTLTDNDEIVHLSLGLAPLIRRDLFCVQQIAVVPTNDTHVPPNTFFLSERGLAKLALGHGAEMVAVGMSSSDSDRVSIKFRVYDLKTNSYPLETTLEGETSKIFKLEKELVHQLLGSLGITLSEIERERLNFSNPKKPEAAAEFGRGLKNEQKGNHTEALIAYRNAVGADSRFAVPYAAEARIFRRFNAPSKVLESYENAVARDEYFAEAWYELNLCEAEYNDDHQKALEYCMKALDIAPRFGKARLSLGARLYAVGRLDEAIEEAETAVALLPTSALARYNLGKLYLHSGDPDQARQWFERALEVDPGFVYAREELEKLTNP